jgi:hypothetical protein
MEYRVQQEAALNKLALARMRPSRYCPAAIGPLCDRLHLLSQFISIPSFAEHTHVVRSVPS